MTLRADILDFDGEGVQRLTDSAEYIPLADAEFPRTAEATGQKAPLPD